jgi:putative aldouronate transport system permease protein
MKIKDSFGERVFDVVNVFILACFCATVIIPVLHIVSGSLSSPLALQHGEVFLWPKDLTFTNLQFVLNNKDFWNSLKNTVFVVVAGTSIGLFLTLLTAFPLSKMYLPGRRLVILMVLFTMIFHAPLIPVYLLVKELHLLNTLWSMIIPSAIGGFNLILCITFLRTISEELYEAARMDGMSENRMLWLIAVPLSTPIIVTLLLFYAVGLWNSYFTPLLYITDRNLQPLQLYLYRIVAQSDTSGAAGNSITEMTINLNPESIQMATVVLATLPIVILYPFLQKHFIKGAMLGSVKE